MKLYSIIFTFLTLCLLSCNQLTIHGLTLEEAQAKLAGGWVMIQPPADHKLSPVSYKPFLYFNKGSVYESKDPYGEWEYISTYDSLNIEIKDAKTLLVALEYRKDYTVRINESWDTLWLESLDSTSLYKQQYTKYKNAFSSEYTMPYQDLVYSVWYGQNESNGRIYQVFFNGKGHMDLLEVDTNTNEFIYSRNSSAFHYCNGNWALFQNYKYSYVDSEIGGWIRGIDVYDWMKPIPSVLDSNRSKLMIYEVKKFKEYAHPLHHLAEEYTLYANLNFKY